MNSLQGKKTAFAADDMTLVHASKIGDIAAFGELVKRYDRRLLRIAQHVTHHYEDAQDAVQEAFLKAFQNLSRFQENSAFSTWLIRITLNESLMKLRKQHAKREMARDRDFRAEEDSPSPEIRDWAPNPEERYRTSEIREILIKTLQRLQPSLRVVFVLHDMDGLSLDETAKVLDLGQLAVKARSSRAWLKLAKD